MSEIKSITDHFNSHAHVERDRSTIFMSLSGVNFNSHAHVERDATGTNYQEASAISTHTLTWSVTYCRVVFQLQK